MTSNLKVILSAVGVAALLTSSALAKTENHRAAPVVNVPANAQGFAGPNGSAVTVYAPDVKVPAHATPTRVNPDFQLSTE